MPGNSPENKQNPETPLLLLSPKKLPKTNKYKKNTEEQDQKLLTKTNKKNIKLARKL